MGKAGHSGRSGAGGQVSGEHGGPGRPGPRAASRLLASAGLEHGFGMPGDLPRETRRPRQVHGRRIVTAGELRSAGAGGPAAPDAGSTGTDRPPAADPGLTGSGAVAAAELAATGKGDLPAVGAVEADGAVSTTDGPPLAVVTADCVPLLLAAPDGAVVAAVHAGWRGLAAGIVEEAVAALGRAAGAAASPSRLLAALGPAASGCCYEVGPEVLEALGLQRGDAAAVEGPRGRPHLDLRVAVRARLLDAGLDARAIERVGPCTICSTIWPSYRRQGTRAGRLAAWIAPA